MVWRTRRFVAVKNAIYYQRFLTISLFANMRPSKFLLSPLVLATFSFCIEFLVHRDDPWPSSVAAFFQLLQENQTFFKYFHMSNVKRFFASLVKLARDRYQLDVPKGAHVQNSSLCVTFGAPWFGPKNRSFCECSKYVTFSIIFCAPVLRITVCVAPRARRCEVPCRALGDLLAASAVRSRHECRHDLHLSEFDPPRLPSLSILFGTMCD